MDPDLAKIIAFLNRERVRATYGAVGEVLGDGAGVALGRIAVAAAAGRLDQEHVAGPHRDAHLLGLEDTRGTAPGEQSIAVRQPGLAAALAEGSLARPVAGGVGHGRLRRLHLEPEHGPHPAALPAVAARIGPKLVVRHEQREAIVT